MVKIYFILISVSLFASCTDIGYDPIGVNYSKDNLVLDFGDVFSEKIRFEPCQGIDLGDPSFIHRSMGVSMNGVLLYTIDIDEVISEYNQLDSRDRKHSVLSIDQSGYSFDMKWYESKCNPGN